MTSETAEQPSVPGPSDSGAGPLRLRYAARSDIGLVRQGNEDSGYAGAHMLVVADGMGGHAAGELASSTTIAAFAELDRQPPGESVLTTMADAVDSSHEELTRIIAESPDFSGMGTTVTALSWEGDRVAIAHVGDSRAYLLRDGALQQLTKDHTFVQTLVDAGRITPEEAAVHDKRNLLIKALDGVHSVEPDLSIREVKSGDRFLLCSDGLSGVLTPDEIQTILSTGDPTGCVTALVERSLEAGAPDNVTVVVADLTTDPDAATHGDESYRMPVVVGAAAELRNRDRLPGIDFPQDAARDPDRADAPASEPETDAEVPTPTGKRKRRLTGLVVSLSVVAALLLGVVGFWFWASNQYYVGAIDGKVGIYQGIPEGFGPNGFSKGIQTSGTPVETLPIYSQEQISQTIPASNLDAARNIVTQLEAQAKQCTEKPKTPGCPPQDKPSPSPIPVNAS